MKQPKMALDHESTTKTLINYILHYIPGSAVPAVLSLLYSVIFTRLVNPREYGEYIFLSSVVALVSVLSSTWLQTSINRYLSTLNAADVNMETEKFHVVHGIILVVSVQVGLAILGAPVVGETLPEKWETIIISCTLLGLGTSLFNVLGVTLQSEFEATTYSRFNIINSILKLILSLILVFNVHSSSQALMFGAATSSLVLVPFLWKKANLPRASLVFIMYP